MPNLPEMNQFFVMAMRHPYWAHDLTSAIKSGDWLIASGVSGKAEMFAVRIDAEKWEVERSKTIWKNYDCPPIGGIHRYIVEIVKEGMYEDWLIHSKPWVEVLAFAEPTDPPKA